MGGSTLNQQQKWGEGHHLPGTLEIFIGPLESAGGLFLPYRNLWGGDFCLKISRIFWNFLPPNKNAIRIGPPQCFKHSKTTQTTFQAHLLVFLVQKHATPTSPTKIPQPNPTQPNPPPAPLTHRKKNTIMNHDVFPLSSSVSSSFLTFKERLLPELPPRRLPELLWQAVRPGWGGWVVDGLWRMGFG